MDELPHVLQLRITRRQVILIPRHQSHLSALDERDRTIPIPLDLKQPLRPVERLLNRFRQHGMNPRRHWPLHRILRKLEPRRTQRTRRILSLLLQEGQPQPRRISWTEMFFRFLPSSASSVVFFLFLLDSSHSIRQPRCLQFPPARRTALPLRRSRVAGNLFQSPTAEHRRVDRRNVVSLHHMIVVLLDHQPLVALAPRTPPAHLDQREIPFQPLPVQTKLQIPLGQHRCRFGLRSRADTSHSPQPARAAATCPHPTRSRFRRRSCSPECFPQNRNTKPDDPRPAPPAACPPDRAMDPSAPPTISARPPSPAGSRSAAASHRASARQSDSPPSSPLSAGARVSLQTAVSACILQAP